MDKKFYETLLSRRQIPLYGRIDKENSEQVCASLMYLNAQSDNKITFFISSGGGIVDYGLGIYDVLMLSRSPITGIVIGRSHSMAAVILQGCARRVAMPHSEICVHPTKGDGVDVLLTHPTETHPYGDFDIEKVREEMSGAFSRMQAICKIFVERTKRPPSEIIKLINRREILTAQKALSEGLVDEVAGPDFRI